MLLFYIADELNNSGFNILLFYSYFKPSETIFDVCCLKCFTKLID